MILVLYVMMVHQLVFIIENQQILIESKWLILLQGGAYYFDSNSCEERLIDLKDKTTSIGLDNTIKDGNGILSSNKIENPQFYNYHIIDFQYCSSDLWTGNSTANENMVLINGTY